MNCSVNHDACSALVFALADSEAALTGLIASMGLPTDKAHMQAFVRWVDRLWPGITLLQDMRDGIPLPFRVQELPPPFFDGYGDDGEEGERVDMRSLLAPEDVLVMTPTEWLVPIGEPWSCPQPIDAYCHIMPPVSQEVTHTLSREWASRVQSLARKEHVVEIILSMYPAVILDLICGKPCVKIWWRDNVRGENRYYGHCPTWYVLGDRLFEYEFESGYLISNHEAVDRQAMDKDKERCAGAPPPTPGGVPVCLRKLVAEESV